MVVRCMSKIIEELELNKLYGVNKEHTEHYEVIVGEKYLLVRKEFMEVVGGSIWT